MRMKDFSVLDQSDQLEHIMIRGVFLADRYTDEFTLILYGLDNFYVELYFHPQTNEMAWIKSFDNTDELEPYLQEIDLSPLV
jgi:hypothetical protein